MSGWEDDRLVAMWSEVAAGVLVRRYPTMDTTICVVRGDDGLLLVDTRASLPEAVELEADLRQLGVPLLWVVNTHAHFDHTFGNQQFGPGSALDLPIYGSHLVAAHLDEYERPRLAAWRDGTGSEPPRDWGQVVVTAPTHPVDGRTLLDLGGRVVELVPLPPGHTDGDLVVHVPDARAWVVGDVVEEPGPPMYGSGCFPLAWPDALAGLLDEVGAADVLVPGHGRPVDREFARAQLAQLRSVAGLVEQHHAAGRTVGEALADRTGWPFPAEGLELAVTRGFAQLDALGAALPPARESDGLRRVDGQPVLDPHLPRRQRTPATTGRCRCGR